MSTWYIVIIIIFEYSENFPNLGLTSLIFPTGEALGPLPKIAKKILDVKRS